jgi:urea carboxylase-associated protein 2
MERIASETLPGAKHRSLVLGGNKRLRLTDLEGGANVGMVFFNPFNLLERYNAPDTLKCQHTFKLTQGHCLYSDMGRIFCSIVADSFGWHDTVCGNTTKASVAAKWGEHSYQDYRNDRYQNGRDSLLIEGSKYGLGPRDLPANVNWFSKTVVADGGSLSLDETAAKPGASVELRFEMDTLVLFHSCAHPLDPSPAFPRRPVQVEIFDGPAATDDDPNRTSAPENGRGFENNRLTQMACCTEAC